MSFVELNIDEEKRQFQIHGDISLIAKNRRAKYYFLDVLNAIINDTSVVIDYIEEDKEVVLQDIQNALEEYNIAGLGAQGSASCGTSGLGRGGGAGTA